VDQIREPQNARSRRTRAAILDAAWRILEELGGGGLVMGEVARRAGVSRRALYLHFASRGELVLALHDHIDEVLDLESSVRPVREAPDAVAALDAFAAHIASFHRKFLAIDRAVMHGRHSDPDLAALYESSLAVWLAGCRKLVKRLHDEGRLAEPWTIATAADMLFALMRDEVVETLAVERAWPVEQHARLLSTLFRRTFVKAAKRGRVPTDKSQRSRRSSRPGRRKKQ
jgi:AcrR family transcriptional regulator